MGPLCQATAVVVAHSEMPFDHKGSIILLRRSAWKSDYSSLVQSFDNIVGALCPNINMHIPSTFSYLFLEDFCIV